MTAIASHTTVLAATDLVSGSHSLYTIGVAVLVVLILLAGGGRAFASFSLPKCESAFQTGSEDIPVPGVNMELRRNCNQALWSALSFAGFPFAGYELNHGLRVALETPDAEPRWLAGEDIFAAVATDDMADVMATSPEAKLLLAVIATVACGREPPANPWFR